MKILLNHADYFEFEVTRKAVKNPEEIDEKAKKAKSENSLVAFIAVEKSDEGAEESVAKQAVSEIEKVMKDVGADNIVVYPYAHLSSNLSSLPTAEKTLNLVYECIRSDKIKVIKAPFGWYKAFKISCKGHPMSELSREITPRKGGTKGKEESEALKAEQSMKSSWAVLTPDGVLHPLKKEGNRIVGFDFSKHSGLKKFVEYEISKSREAEKAPPHVELMQRLELVDYEPGSDPGNLRYYPKGRLIKSLLEDFVTREVRDYGAMEIETPIMYDFEHPSLKKYLNRFPARQYTIETPNKKVFLRFAACFGQFLMAHDATISYKNLPLRLYEMTRYSFRVEKRGELTGLRRLRSFTMPDCHAFVSDLGMAKEEMLKRFELSQNILTRIGLKPKQDLEMGLRVVKDFYGENKDFVDSLVKRWGKPVLVEMWDSRFFYFVMKYEWNFVDCLEKASALTTDQIDVENSKTYDIKYVDKDGSEKYPLIMHLSPSGAIERVIYALLERAYMDMEAGKAPQLPLWLAPTQVRVIPITQENMSYARKVIDELTSMRIRADIDDRELTLGKKIREAEGEWVPYVAVVGAEEENKGNLSVRVRGEKDQKGMAPKALATVISEKTKDMPFKSLPMAPELSKRPKFVGWSSSVKR